MKKFVSFFPLAVLLFFQGSISGAESVTPLEPMIVSATRWETDGVPTAGSITVITREEIINTGAATITEILRGKGGVQILDFYGDGSRARVDMRGFGDTAGFNTLILVDGRRLNNTDLHDPDLNFIALKDVERIEIIQGSAAVLYGDQAVGGVINIITRKATGLVVEFQAAYGSYERQAQTLKLANRFDNGTGVRLTAERRLSDNYRDNNDLVYTNGLLKLTHDWGRGDVFVNLQRTDEKIGIPGDLLISQLKVSRTQTDTPLDFNDTTSEIVHGGGSVTLAPDWQAAAEYTHRQEDVKAVISFGGVPFQLKQERLHQSFNARLRGLISCGGQELFLTAGADIEKTGYALTSSLGGTNSTQYSRGLYALGIAPVNDLLDVTGGVRRAWVENDIVDTFAAPGGTVLNDDQTVSSLGLVMRPAHHTRLFLKRESNFRTPLIDEQTSVVGFQAPLKTQTGTSYEAGIEWFNDRLSAKLTGYLLELEDEIIFDQSSFTNVNLDPTERTGAILEVNTTFGRGVTLTAQYTYTDARFADGPYAGNRIPLVSAHQAHIGLGWLMAPGWSLYGDVLLVSDKIAGNDFASQFPGVGGYGIGNLRLHFDKGRYSFAAGINNILDEKYSESAAVNFTGQTGYFPAPERNFLLVFEYGLD